MKKLAVLILAALFAFGATGAVYSTDAWAKPSKSSSDKKKSDSKKNSKEKKTTSKKHKKKGGKPKQSAQTRNAAKG